MTHVLVMTLVTYLNSMYRRTMNILEEEQAQFAIVMRNIRVVKVEDCMLVRPRILKRMLVFVIHDVMMDIGVSVPFAGKDAEQMKKMMAPFAEFHWSRLPSIAMFGHQPSQMDAERIKSIKM